MRGAVDVRLSRIVVAGAHPRHLFLSSFSMKNDELCIKHDEFCVKRDGFSSSPRSTPLVCAHAVRNASGCYARHTQCRARPPRQCSRHTSPSPRSTPLGSVLQAQRDLSIAGMYIQSRERSINRRHVCTKQTAYTRTVNSPCVPPVSSNCCLEL